MEIDVIWVFVILAVTIILFVTEFYPVDKVSFFLIVSLTLLGIVTPEEAISGFSNSATITVLCLMIIAIGLEENGVIAWLSNGLKKLSILPLILITPVFMIITASISAFISTTAVVIVFIKIIFLLAERYKIPSGKLLMPISFAGILGGSCTLMGTSTNLIVNSVAQDLGAERLGFFEFAIFGAAFLAVGIIFITFASRWLPREDPSELKSAYDLDELITTVEIGKDSPLINKRIDETLFYDNSELSVLKMTRNFAVTNAPGRYIKLKQGDRLVVMGDFDNIIQLSKEEGFIINENKEREKLKGEKKKEDRKNKDEKKKKEQDTDEAEEIKLTYAELLMLPGSVLLGKTLKDLRSYSLQGAVPIAIKKRKNLRNTKERLIRKDINSIRLKPGDRVLVEIPERNISRLDKLENVAVLQQHDFTTKATKTKRGLALGILLAVIGLAASGVLSILASSITGVALLLLTNCLELNKVYKKVDWQIIFLLAGMIPLGVAMHNSGADIWISEKLLDLLSGKNNVVILGLIFLVTMIMSGTISNNATAIIMAPIAISVASGLELPTKPFLLAVMFAANFSFFTPVGYQTNALIYGMGIYRFKHFFIIGGILSIILLVMGTLMLSTLL